MARGLEMVYCDQDMCESKLGRLIQAFRADRPDEWTMDEFIGMAEQMHKEIELLRQAEKDAARYRWVIEQFWFQDEAYWRLNIKESELSVEFGDDVGKAIDEAMQCK